MENDMNRATERAVQGSKDEQVVLEYPGNSLKNQVRDFDDTLSAFSVAKAAFFPAK